MYLTRNQAGVYSASGVRIPPSPPDTHDAPQGAFCVSGGEGLEESPIVFDKSAGLPIWTAAGYPQARSAGGCGPWMARINPLRQMRNDARQGAFCVFDKPHTGLFRGRHPRPVAAAHAAHGIQGKVFSHVSACRSAAPGLYPTPGTGPPPCTPASCIHPYFHFPASCSASPPRCPGQVRFPPVFARRAAHD